MPKPQQKTKIKAKTKVSKKTIKKETSPRLVGLGPKKKKEGYYSTVGRRKEAVARIRLSTSSPDKSAIEGNFMINEKPYKKFFSTLEFRKIAESPLKRLKSLNRFKVTAKVRGGGVRGQAEAIRHGLARALVKFDPNFRKKLKKSGYLTRDSRKKERKKFGLRKARRASQWHKR